MIKRIKKLSDTILRKFVEVIDCSNWQIESDIGWNDIKTINKTVPYQIYKLRLKSGKTLACADNHILIDKHYNEVFAKYSLGKEICTIDGPDEVIEIIITDNWEHMYDFSLSDNTNHLFYTNGILSHNSTIMTIVALWTALFFPDQTIVMVANKSATAVEIFMRVRLAFLQMDNWVKGGIVEFNKTFFTLANGSRILTSATSPDSIRGLSIDVLLLDEFGVIPKKIAEDFWAAVLPTLASRFNNNPNAKLIVASTPKGVGNKFHELVSKAEQGLNDFVVEKAVWSDVPGRDEKWKEDEISTMGYDRFTQEYECRFLNNSGSPFDSAMFDKFDKELIEPINILEDGNYLIWAPPSPEKIYTMGVDTSEGTGQDYSVIQIFDITNPRMIEQVARYSTNLMDTTTWSAKIAEIAKQWYSPIMLVERNGPGTTPCDKLYNEQNYPRFINFGTKETIATRAGRSFRPGIISSLVSKGMAVTNMKYYAHDRRCVKIYDKVTINELRTFSHIRTESNHYKWTAQNGFHDDHVIAMVWALFTLHKGAINDYLVVTEQDGNNLPIKIEKKWQYNPSQDFNDSLYKKMERELQNVTSLIGVVAMKGQIFNDPTIESRDKVGTLAYLLNQAESVNYSDYVAELPQSFNRYMY